MPDFRIVVKIDPSGARRGGRQVEGALNRINASADRTRRLLARAFTFTALALGAKQLVDIADRFTTLQNRLRTVTEGQGDLNNTLAKLSGIATRTRTSLEGIVRLYQRGSIAAEALSASQEDLLLFVERVGKAMAIQGGATSEASGALRQLSQTLSSGIVRAEEFNSILEGAFPIALAAAAGIDRAGGSVARLRQLIIVGEVISKEFFRGFLEGSKNIDELFRRTTPTIGQAFQVLRDQVVLFLGELDKGAGVSASFAQVLLEAAKNLDVLARAAGAVAIVIGVALAQRAIPAATRALIALGAAALANPFTVILFAVTALVAVLITFGDLIPIAEDRLASLQDLGVVTFEALLDAADTFVGFFEKDFAFIADQARSIFKDVELSVEGVLRVAARVVDGTVGFFVGVAKAIPIAFENIPAALELIFVRAFNFVIRQVTSTLNFIIKGINLVRAAVGKSALDFLEPFQLITTQPAEEFGKRLDASIAKGIRESNAAEQALEGLLKRAEERASDRQLRESRAADSQGGGGRSTQERAVADPVIAKFLKDLARENVLLQLNSREREIQAKIFQLEVKLKRDLTVAERAEIEQVLRRNQALATQAQILDDIHGPQEQYMEDVAALQALQARGAISQGEFNQRLRETRLALLDVQTGTFDGFERGFLRAQESMADFASSSERLITDAFREAQDAVVEFFKTGKFSADDFFNSLADNFLRLGTQQAFSALIGGASGGGGGIGGLISSFFQGSGAGGSIGSTLAGSFGFQNGVEGLPVGAASVASLPGVDNRLVQFRAKSNETIDVNKPGKSGGGRSMVINFNFPAGTDVDSFRRQEGKIQARISAGLSRSAERDS